ncbi:MAG: cyclic nucleotide-binding domain-containing protein [Burkholderiaceae bacterium]|jgi:CRP-like cAMP-binding protein|nr:cyclic nucleotide-binding domain-containing protein [Burkholderiaceae bacterium]
MSGFTEAKFNAGEVLFNAGDPAKELFILQKGEIELLDSGSGKAFAKLKAGESFGEQAVLAAATNGSLAGTTCSLENRSTYCAQSCATIGSAVS